MSEQEKLGHGVNDASGTITLSTGLGDNINLNFMTGLSDDEEGQVFILTVSLAPSSGADPGIL